MRILVIVAHPDPTSLNHAIAQTALETLRELGHEPLYHDLYAEAFPPSLPAAEIARKAELPDIIAEHCQDLADAQGIIIVHPNWWGMPPAILKGWIDRVIRPGVAYAFVEGDSGEGVPIGLLKAQTALILNTANTPHEREVTAFGDPLERLWRDCIFDLCGLRDVRRRMFTVVVTSDETTRKRWLDEVERLVRECFAE